MNVTELDELETAVRTRHASELQAITTVRELCGGQRLLPGVELRRLQPRVVIEGNRHGKTEAAGAERRALPARGASPKLSHPAGVGLPVAAKRGPGSSKTAIEARGWVEGLAVGTQFTIGEISAFVCKRTGVAEETVKMRMYPWLAEQGSAFGVSKCGRGLYENGAGGAKKAGPSPQPPPRGEGGKKAAVETGPAGETWREKMERLRVLQEEAGVGKGQVEGSPE